MRKLLDFLKKIRTSAGSAVLLVGLASTSLLFAAEGKSSGATLDKGTNQAAEGHLFNEHDPMNPATAGMLHPTVSLSDSTIGAHVIGNFHFETESLIPPGGKIQITFPKGFGLADTHGKVNVGDFTSEATHNKVILTHKGTSFIGPSAVAVRLVRLVNPLTPGPTGKFLVKTLTPNGETLDQGEALGVNIEKGLLTDLQVQLSSLALGATDVTATVSFTTVGPLLSGGGIQIRFPGSFNTAGVTLENSRDFSVLSAHSSQVTLLNEGNDIPTGERLSFSLRGLTNSTELGKTKKFFTTVLSPHGKVTAQGTAEGVDIEAGKFPHLNLTLSDLTAGATGEATVNLTTISPLAFGDGIRISFPDDFNVAGATLTHPDFFIFSADQSPGNPPHVILAANQDTNIMAGESLSLTVKQIGNPATPGLTGKFLVETVSLTPAGIEVTAQGEVQGVEIEAEEGEKEEIGTLSHVNLTLSDLTAEATVEATVDLTTLTPLAYTDGIRITFPDGFNVAGSTVIHPDFFPLFSSSSQIILSVTQGTNIKAGENLNFTVEQIENPATPGLTGKFLVETISQGPAETIEVTAQGEVQGVEIEAEEGEKEEIGTLSHVNLTLSDLTAEATVEATVDLTTLTPLAYTDGIRITFPDGFNVAGSTVIHPDFFPLFSSSSQIILSVTQGTNIKAGENLNFTVEQIENPATPGLTGKFLVETISQGPAETIEVTAQGEVQGVEIEIEEEEEKVLSDLQVQLSSLALGETNVTAIVSFTAASPILPDGTVQINFPGFKVEEAILESDGDFSIESAISPQVILLNEGDSIAVGEELTFTFSGLGNPTKLGNTESFSAAIHSPEGTVTAQGMAEGVDIEAGKFPHLNLTLSDLTAGATVEATVNLTTISPLAFGDGIRISFPDDFNVAGVTLTHPDFFIFSADQSPGNPPQVILAANQDTNIMAGESLSLTVKQTGNPATPGLTGKFLVETVSLTPAGIEVTAQGEVQGVEIEIEEEEEKVLSDLQVQLSSLALGETDVTASVSFTAASPILPDGTVQINFPGFKVEEAILESDGDFSIESAISPQVILLNEGDTIAVGEELTFTFSGLGNPTKLGNTESFSAAIHSPEGTVTAQGMAEGVDIEAGKFPHLNLTLSDLTAGATVEATVNLTTISPLAFGDGIRISFPDDFNVAGVTLTHPDFFIFSADQSPGNPPQVILAANQDTNIMAGESLSLTVKQTGNPATPGLTGKFLVETVSLTPAGIEVTAQGEVQGVEIEIEEEEEKVLSDLQVQLSSFALGETNVTAIVSFTAASPILPDGTVQINFPGFKVEEAILESDGDFSIESAISPQVILLNEGDIIAVGEELTFTFSGLGNPTKLGNTESFSAAIHSPEGTVTAQGTAEGVDIEAGKFPHLNLTLSDLTAGATGEATVNLTTISPLAFGDGIRISFPDDFNVAGATLTHPDFFIFSAGQSPGNLPHVILAANQDTNIMAGESLSLTVKQIGNPATPGLTGKFLVETVSLTPAGIKVTAQGEVQGVEIEIEEEEEKVLSDLQVQLSSLALGETDVTAIVSFTAVSPILPSGTVHINFPPGFNAEEVTLESGGDFSLVPDTSPQIILFNEGDGIAAGEKLIFTLSELENPTSLGNTESFSAAILSLEGKVTAQGTAEGVHIEAGKFPHLNLTLSDLTAGATVEATVNLTTLAPLASGDGIQIDFPNGFDALNATLNSGSHLSIHSTSPSQVTLVINGESEIDAGDSLSVIIGNLINPTSPGETENFLVKSFSQSPDKITAQSEASGFDLESLLNASVTYETSVVGTTTYVDIALTATNPWPETGMLEIVFPDGFDLTQIGQVFSPDGSVEGSFSFSVGDDGRTLTITRNGSGPVTGPLLIRITNVINPTTLLDTGFYSITLLDEQGGEIDGNPNIPLEAIVPPPLNSQVTLTSSLIGDTGSVALHVMPAKTISQGGYIELTLPSGFGVPEGDLSVTILDESISGTLLASGSGQTITITHGNSGTFPKGKFIKLEVAGITNSSTKGQAGNFKVMTKDPNNSPLEQATLEGPILVMAAVIFENKLPGETGPVDLIVHTSETLADDGQVDLTFPAGFVIPSTELTASVGLGSEGAILDGSFDVSVENQTVSLTRSDGSDAPAGKYRIQLSSGIINPNLPGATDSFGIHVHDDDSEELDTLPGVLIHNPALLTFVGSGNGASITEFTGSASVTFQVAYTSPDGSLPTSANVLIDSDGDGYEPNEIHPMFPNADGSYSLTTTIYYSSSSEIPYKFEFHDSVGEFAAGEAAADPAGTLVAFAPPAIPLLEDPNSANDPTSPATIVAGVNTSLTGGNVSGTPGEIFEFRTVYSEAAGNPPSLAQVCVDLDGDGMITDNETFTMVQVDLEETDYASGVSFSFSLPLYALEKNAERDYYFNFASNQGAATGTPSEFRTLKIAQSSDLNSNGIPDEQELGDPENTDVDGDGKPNHLDSNTGFMFLPKGNSAAIILPEETTLLKINNVGSNHPTIGVVGKPLLAEGSDNLLLWPWGFYTFEAENVGSEVEVKIMFEGAEDLENLPELWHHNTQTGAWVQIDYALEGNMLTYTLVDGGPFDEDGEVNGRIIDPIGLGAIGSSSGSGFLALPSHRGSELCLLSQRSDQNLWSFITVLGLGVIGLGIYSLRKRKSL